MLVAPSEAALAEVVVNICIMETPINVHKHEWKLNVASRHRVCEQPCTADLPSIQSRCSGLETLITTYGGCDYVTGEASFEEEACDQIRRTGVSGRRFDFCARRRRIGVGRSGSGCTANDEPRAASGTHAR